MNRREFFISIFRVGALAGVVSLAGYLLLKNKGNEENCEVFNACSSCSSKTSCKKPEAINYRRDETGE